MAINIQLGYKDYTDNLGIGLLDSRVTYTGFEYALFSIAIATSSVPTLTVNEYYRVDFIDGGGDVVVSGVYRYGGSYISGGNTILLFAYYGLAYLDTTATDATIYGSVDVVSTQNGISVKGEYVTTIDRDGYFIGPRRKFEGECIFTDDAYDVLMDLRCSSPYFYVWINLPCTGSTNQIELVYSFDKIAIDEGACKITATPDDKDITVPEEFKTNVNVMPGTGFSIYDWVTLGALATIPTGSPIIFTRMGYVGDVFNKLIGVSKAKVYGFRSTLLNINDPGDYTYTTVETFADYSLSGVTGHSFNLFLTGLSNMLNPNGSNPQTVLMMNLEGLLTNLCKMYNALYFIDSDGYIRLEHLEYFDNIGSAISDFTTVNKMTIIRKDSQVKKFTLEHTYMYSGTIVHAFADAYLISSLQNGQFDSQDEIKLEKLATDLQTLLKMNDGTWAGDKWPNNKDDSYFITVLGDSGNATPPVNEQYSDTLHTGWDYLIRMYHRHNVPYSVIYGPKAATRNGKTYVSEVVDDIEAILPASLKPDIEVSGIALQNCCESTIEIGDYLPTSQGNAIISEYRYDLLTNVATIKGKLRQCP